MSRLSQYLASTMVEHFTVAMKVLKYVKPAPAKGFFFPAVLDLKLSGFVDVDWGSYLDTRRSIIGFFFFLGQALISWKCKKQTIVRSSSKAEYKALVIVGCEAQWLSFLLQDLKVVLTEPIPMFCDKKSTIHIATIQFSMRGQGILR